MSKVLMFYQFLYSNQVIQKGGIGHVLWILPSEFIWFSYKSILTTSKTYKWFNKHRRRVRPFMQTLCGKLGIGKSGSHIGNSILRSSIRKTGPGELCNRTSPKLIMQLSNLPQLIQEGMHRMWSDLLLPKADKNWFFREFASVIDQVHHKNKLQTKNKQINH